MEATRWVKWLLSSLSLDTPNWSSRMEIFSSLISPLSPSTLLAEVEAVPEAGMTEEEAEALALVTTVGPVCNGEIDKSNTSLSILSLVEGGLPVTDSNLYRKISSACYTYVISPTAH